MAVCGRCMVLAALALSGVASRGSGAPLPRYTVKAIGGMGWINAINDKRQVAGRSLSRMPARWENGQVVSYTQFANSSFVDYNGAVAINNAGVMVGRIADDSGSLHAARFNNDTTTTLLEMPGEHWNNASAINDSGDIAGANDWCDTCEDHAALWRHDGTLVDLNDFLAGSIHSQALAVNNAGVIAGTYLPPSDTMLGFFGFPGAFSDLPTLPGLPPTPTIGGINNRGVVAGSIFRSADGYHGVMWDEAGIHPIADVPGMGIAINDSNQLITGTSIWQNGVLTDVNTLIDSASGWRVRSLFDINNRGDMIGQATQGTGGYQFVILLASSLEITYPPAGTLFVSGERDTIRWNLRAGVDSVKLSYSTDGGATYAGIKDSYPADPGLFVWKVPQLTSRKTEVRVENKQDPADYDSRTIKVKGLELARVTASGDYEVYRPDKHGWSFENNEPPMWPPEWWFQFDYAGYPDPFRDQPEPQNYPNSHPWSAAEPPNFPDWPLFVESFTLDQCYRTYPNGSRYYRPLAVETWDRIKSKEYGGSCFGFSNASFLFFGNKQALRTAFPAVPDSGLLSQVLPDHDTLRMAINQIYTYQYGIDNFNYKLEAETTVTPLETFEQIRQMIRGETWDLRVLALVNQNRPGGHAVSPYKIVDSTGTPGQKWIYIYDPNSPGDSTKRVVIDSTLNYWLYPYMPDGTWGGFKGLFLLRSSSASLTHPRLGRLPRQAGAAEPLAKDAAGPATASRLELYTPAGPPVTLTNADGMQIGYADSVVFNHIAGALPIVPLTGRFHPPIGYSMPPSGGYAAELRPGADSVTLLTIFADSTIMKFVRENALPGDTDHLRWENGLSVISRDALPRAVTLRTVYVSDSADKVFELTNLSLGQGDSVSMSEPDRSELRVANYGRATTYDLHVELGSTQGAASFDQHGVPLRANSAHLLAPGWAALGSGPLTILIDDGNDGTVDDTLFLAGQVTSGVYDDSRGAARPASFALAQNYPNPFNPTTTIEFALPRAEEVSLEVYDLLWCKVATIVSGPLAAGRHAVQWTPSGLASGVYLCRLKAGTMTATKKLLLLK